MIKQAMEDYLTLDKQFSELTPDALRTLKVKTKGLLERESYQYVKYCILKRAINRIERGLKGKESPSHDLLESAFMVERLVNSLKINEKAKRESHFRG